MVWIVAGGILSGHPVKRLLVNLISDTGIFVARFHRRR